MTGSEGVGPNEERFLRRQWDAAGAIAQLKLLGRFPTPRGLFAAWQGPKPTDPNLPAIPTIARGKSKKSQLELLLDIVLENDVLCDIHRAIDSAMGNLIPVAFAKPFDSGLGQGRFARIEDRAAVD